MLGKSIKRQQVKLLFENPYIFSDLFPHDASAKHAVATHFPLLNELGQLASLKDSKGFWSKIKSSGNSDTITRVGYLIYRYLKEFQPDDFEWYVEELIAGKNVKNF